MGACFGVPCRSRTDVRTADGDDVPARKEHLVIVRHTSAPPARPGQGHFAGIRHHCWVRGWPSCGPQLSSFCRANTPSRPGGRRRFRGVQRCDGSCNCCPKRGPASSGNKATTPCQCGCAPTQTAGCLCRASRSAADDWCQECTVAKCSASPISARRTRCSVGSSAREFQHLGVSTRAAIPSKVRRNEGSTLSRAELSL